MLKQDSEDIFSTKVENAILVGIALPNKSVDEAEQSLQELIGLVDTMGLATVDTFAIKLREINSRYLIGLGKLEELKTHIASSEKIDCIIFDTALSPSQQRNLEEYYGICVIDREEVIIDIFAGRAKTKEAILQVNLARLQYSLPRLTRAWTHLSRQRGGAGATRDSGETQLETDRRIVLEKISSIKRELKKVIENRKVMKKKRESIPMPAVSIIGYTNAGKSSLLNILSGSDCFVEDRLFATLDPTTRKVSLDNGTEIVLTDTVGFIQNLPHTLIESFKATIEETMNADLLIHTVDCSNPNFLTHIKTTEKVLMEMNAIDKNSILVFNKIDLIDKEKLDIFETQFKDAIFISVKKDINLDVLKKKVLKKISNMFILKKYLFKYSDYDIICKIKREGKVVSENFNSESTEIEAYIPENLEKKLKDYEY